MKKLEIKNQYRRDIFNKMDMTLKKGNSILDVGCGDGGDLAVFDKVYKLDVFGTDIMENNSLAEKYNYTRSSIYKLPYKKNQFDYVFLHNVLHHIDEPKQRLIFYKKAMSELKRVVKRNGYIFILEGNRYNPLFYPHMVKLEGHNHFTNSFFISILKKNFKDFSVKNFEAHLYPPKFIRIFKVYEIIMDKIFPAKFRAYNFGIIKNVK